MFSLQTGGWVFLQLLVGVGIIEDVVGEGQEVWRVQDDRCSSFVSRGKGDVGVSSELPQDLPLSIVKVIFSIVKLIFLSIVLFIFVQYVSNLMSEIINLATGG